MLNLFTNVGQLLRADAFVYMYHVFVPNVHCSANALKVVSLHYINYSGYAIKKTVAMNVETFLYTLKNFLAKKYQHIELEFNMSRHTKNVHMGLNYSLLELHEHKKIIFDIEERCLSRIQDMSFEFVLPQLIHTDKWTFDYIILRRVKMNSSSNIIIQFKTVWTCACM